jgi:TolA-binding protein
MEKALRKNEQLENTYREIREICGTPSLKIMVDKILTKETSYNDSLAQINELQNQIDIYDKDIAELEIKLKKLKNVVIFQEKNEKTISTLPSNIIQEEENNLIKEEEKLIEEEKLLKEKLAQINLTYKKIMENIEFFISEQKASENTSHVDEKIIKKIIIMMIQMKIFTNRQLRQVNRPTTTRNRQEKETLI